ncbi:NAD(P)-dependent oxidoreductase [Rhizobium sp. CC-YZS058]|uniref:NAD-dependent epimerase/dehydratase family protein n=1 Tax=Rhizobium sp. CC-YZS058 TaxID=3042153 RepID=UPI002B053DA1|nr:NAD(P)-dependent oxidoreductase [Rhizobium sp. CC-YZS058]MEA3536214.1 NAD(P)-dependent oxidoreductase [Rhizobium sp. CC-YZS058]
MPHILLTGATGFVGRQIHKRLVANGHAVTAILRPNSAGRLAAPVAGSIETPDLFSEPVSWWQAAAEGMSTVIHAAWFVEPGRYLDAPDNLACLAGTLRLAEGAEAAGVDHVIGVGTCFEYRLPGDRLSIDAPTGPTSLYAACKLSSFLTLEAFFASRRTRFSWCRLFYLFGEGEHPRRLVPYLRQQLERGEVAKLSAGTQVRDFLDVAAAGAMIADVVDTGQPGAINICSGEAVTIRQLAERIADDYGRRDLLEFGTAPLNATDPPAVVGHCNALSKG